MSEWLGPVDSLAGQPLRPAQNETHRAPEPLDYPGRFFDGKTHHNLNDALTGIPMAFVPNPKLPPRHLGGEVDGKLVANLHHPAHPRAELENGTHEQQAIRHSRVQWVTTEDHWRGYHDAKLQPLVPDIGAKSFVYVAAAAARYIPPRGLEFVRQGDILVPTVREMKYEDKAKLWNEHQIKVDWGYKVRRYLAAYAMEQGFQELPGITRQLRDMYLEEPELIAQSLLRSLVSTAVAQSGFDQVYRKAQKYTLIPRGSQKSAERSLMGYLLPGTLGYGLSRANDATLQKLHLADARTLQQLHEAAVNSAEGIAA